MAFELNNRTKVIAGVALLALAGAGAGWYFFLQDTGPAPRATAPAKPAAKAAAQAAKGAPDAAKPAAETAKQASAPSAATGPVPTDPDKALSEFMEGFGRNAIADAVGNQWLRFKTREKEVAAAFDREFEIKALYLEIVANMKKDYDAARMSRYLELQRQPIARKMAAMRSEQMSDQESDARMAKLKANMPSPERMKLLARINEIGRKSGLGVAMGQPVERGYVEGVLELLQSRKDGQATLKQIGKGDPRNARAVLQTDVAGDRSTQIKISTFEEAGRYFNATDAELAEYVKLIDTEMGEWGAARLAAAMVPAMEKRGREVGRAFAQVAIDAQKSTARAETPGAQPAAKIEEEKPATKPTAAPAAAPAAAPGYRRPVNIRDVYTRYNDLVSATVMRDSAAVKELLDDGKSPNVRQSDGLTPLMIAASNGDAGIAAMLLAKGADPNLRTQGGRTALSLAKARGAAGAETVQLLQRSGARE